MKNHDFAQTKSTTRLQGKSFSRRSLVQLTLCWALVAAALSCGGCAKKQPPPLFTQTTSARVGGPMRIAKYQAQPRTPPLLPVVDSSASADYASMSDIDAQPPPPPPSTLTSSAKPEVYSSVPAEADGYFQEPANVTYGGSVLGALFESIFQPATPPVQSVSSARYRMEP